MHAATLQTRASGACNYKQKHPLLRRAASRGLKKDKVYGTVKDRWIMVLKARPTGL